MVWVPLNLLGNCKSGGGPDRYGPGLWGMCGPIIEDIVLFLGHATSVRVFLIFFFSALLLVSNYVSVIIFRQSSSISLQG